VGRSRSEDGLDADLATGPATGDWSSVDGDWDWDAEWAATQADDRADHDDDPDADGTEATGGPDLGHAADAPATAAAPRVGATSDTDPADTDLREDDVRAGDRPGAPDADDATPDAREARRLRVPVTVPAPLRRPPGRRGPVLLAVAVLGAVLTGVFGGLGGGSAPVASGQDYGLGMADGSFSGGVDVEGARGEISQAEAQARLSEIAASRAAREPDFVVPTDGLLTTCFCQRWGSMHWGIDLAAPLGTPIFAASDGVVLRAGPASGYGNAIYIQDADGNVEIYGHMRYYDVQAGDVVSAGEQIAKVGNQGQSTGPHLHFEIHVGGMNGTPTDPQEWLAERGLSVG
jgi:murein DD-endopeptidase MepM/ murein hydrolase activator NlpD